MPFKDKHKVIGCQIIYAFNKEKVFCINLIEEKYQNQYIYQSKIIKIGHKKFMINNEMPQEYLSLISTKLSHRIINPHTKDYVDLFTKDETQVILRNCIELYLRMNIPTLEYLLLNSYKDLKQKDYFNNQEILLGKSIFDLDLCQSEC